MYRIRFQTASRIWTFDEHRVVRVGSAPDSDIVLDEPGICPLHAELRPTDAGWELHSSASGSSTWVNGERVEDTTPLGPSTEMRFGAQDGGVDAVIAIEEPTATTTDEASQAPGAGQLVVNINSSAPGAQFVQKSQQLNVTIT